MQKKRNNKQIPAKLKSEILAELSEADCVVSNLAKTYDLSPKTLYSWRKTMGLGQESVRFCDKAALKFVELAVEDAKEQETGVAGAGSEEGEGATEVILLKKCELTFSDFSVIIEGRVSLVKLMNILKILEAVC